MSFLSVFSELPLSKENNKAISEYVNKKLSSPTNNVIKMPEPPKQELVKKLVEKKKDIESQIRNMTICRGSVSVSAIGYSGVPFKCFLADDEIEEFIIKHLDNKLTEIKEVLSGVDYPEGFRGKAYKVLGYKTYKNGDCISVTKEGDK